MFTGVSFADKGKRGGTKSSWMSKRLIISRTGSTPVQRKAKMNVQGLNAHDCFAQT